LKNLEQNIDHLFRHQYGKMVAVLTRLFSFSDLEKAEDIVQDTFAKALTNWRINGLPDNPEAWLMQVAKNRGIDYFRSRKGKLTKEIQSQYLGTTAIAVDKLFLENEIADAQLRMIFACCHPVLNESDQIAVTLQIVSGFSIKEIASALLKPAEQIKKRIQRAKTKLKSNSIELSIPQGKELRSRRATVLKIIYLLFNEGYASSNDNELIKKDLCVEALRLGKLICDHFITKYPDAQALVGLMCFLVARFESRIDGDGHMILFENQDRSKWDKAMIYIGNKYMFEAVATNTYSKYHYEAAIQAEYMKADDIANTDWDQILDWYTMLSNIDASPIIELNIGIVHLYKGDVEQSRSILLGLDINTFGSRKYLLLSALARLFEESKELDKALDYLLEAYKTVTTKAEKSFIEKRIEKLN